MIYNILGRSKMKRTGRHARQSVLAPATLLGPHYPGKKNVFSYGYRESHTPKKHKRIPNIDPAYFIIASEGLASDNHNLLCS